MLLPTNRRAKDAGVVGGITASSNKGYNFKFSNLCGVAYESGDVKFSNASCTSIVSPVGNRLSEFDLKEHRLQTFAFETRNALRRIAVHDNLLVVCDADEGRGMLINKSSSAVLHRINFKGRVHCMEFSSNGKYLAIGIDHTVQVWICPTNQSEKSFSPLILARTFTGHSDDVICLRFGNGFIVTGSRDTTVRIFTYRSLLKEEEEEEEEKELVKAAILSGHRTKIIGVFPKNNGFIYSVSEDGTLIQWKKIKEEETSYSWKVGKRHYVQNSHAKVTSAASNVTDLLLLGFDDGTFSLVELSTGEKLQMLSVSKFAIEACDMSTDGKWLVMGSPTLGQLLVWEWQSETYILKQQGHYYSLNSCDFSSDGRYFATGGDDCKLKVSSLNTGLSFVTFSDHVAPITGICFVKGKNSLLSSSLDGTVRAFDLSRMRHFKTLTPPQQNQLYCLAVDDDVVCAGGFDPPSIYVWSLRSGQILDVLSGHEGPISCLLFAKTKLISSSWDGSIRVWQPYKSGQASEMIKHNNSNVLCLAVSPDGSEICTSGVDCVLNFFREEKLVKSIDCKRDLNENSEKKEYSLNSVCYSSDGKCILAGGKSNWVFIYDIERSVLLKKFQLSHLRSKTSLEEAQEINEGDGIDARRKRWRENVLPGASRGKNGLKRSELDESIKVSCVKFSPTGRSFICASNIGLLVYSFDATLLFDPIEFSEEVTPQSCKEAFRRGDYIRCVLLALHLNEESLLVDVFGGIPKLEMEAISAYLPNAYLARALYVVGLRIEKDPNVEYNLLWANSILKHHHATFTDRDFLSSSHSIANAILSALRMVQKAIVQHQIKLGAISDENYYDMKVLLSSSKEKNATSLTTTTIKTNSSTTTSKITSSSSSSNQRKRKVSLVEEVDDV